MNTDDFIFWTMFILCIVCSWGFYGVGHEEGVTQTQLEAIKRGYAVRTVNQETAEVKFEWKEGKEQRMEKIIENIDSVVEIQGRDGNWNYDPYMHGLYNGMLLIQAIVKGNDINYQPRKAPKEWLKDKDIGDVKPVCYKESEDK